MASTPAYTDTQGRKITQTAYDAQKKSGIDVSGFKPIAAPVIANKGNINDNKITTQNFTDISTQDVTPVAGITDAMKNTDVYKNLLNKGFTEAQIGESFKNKTSIDKITPAGNVQPQIVTPSPKKDVVPEIKETPVDTTDTTGGKPDYQSNTNDRLLAIRNNLEEAYSINPSGFTTYDKFKTDYDYNQRSATQKQILDSFYNSKVGPKYDTFGNMTETQISDAYIGGTLTDGDLLNLKVLDPAKRQLAQTAISNANTYGDANSSLSGKLESVRKQLGITPPEDINLVDKFNEYVNTPEAQELNSTLAEQQGKIDILDQKMADMDKTIADKYAGTGMTQDIIDAISADNKEALSRERTRLAIGYNTNLNKYNAIYKAGTDKMQAYKDQIALDRQERQDTMSQLGFYYESTPEGMAETAAAQATNEPIDIQTKDFGTSKSPDWRQSLDGGKTWQKIDGITGGGTGGIGGSTKMGGDIVSLLKEYKTILDGSGRASLQLNPTQKGKLISLKSQITAIYKQKQKLGTLDNGVINLMNGLLGDAGVFSPTHYSNTAQSSAVNDLINRWSNNTAYVGSTNNGKNIKVETNTQNKSTIPTTIKKTDLSSIFKNIFKFEAF